MTFSLSASHILRITIRPMRTLVGRVGAALVSSLIAGLIGVSTGCAGLGGEPAAKPIREVVQVVCNGSVDHPRVPRDALATPYGPTCASIAGSNCRVWARHLGAPIGEVRELRFRVAASFCAYTRTFLGKHPRGYQWSFYGHPAQTLPAARRPAGEVPGLRERSAMHPETVKARRLGRLKGTSRETPIQP
jgi:hypothetical protein